jgi:hypothetical protein
VFFIYSLTTCILNDIFGRTLVISLPAKGGHVYQIVHCFLSKRVNTAGTTLTQTTTHPDEAIGHALINPREKKKGATWSSVTIGISSHGHFMPLFQRTLDSSGEWQEYWYNAARPACRELREIRKMVGTL